MATKNAWKTPRITVLKYKDGDWELRFFVWNREIYCYNSKLNGLECEEIAYGQWWDLTQTEGKKLCKLLKSEKLLEKISEPEGLYIVDKNELMEMNLDWASIYKII